MLRRQKTFTTKNTHLPGGAGRLAPASARLERGARGSPQNFLKGFLCVLREAHPKGAVRSVVKLRKVGYLPDGGIRSGPI